MSHTIAGSIGKHAGHQRSGTKFDGIASKRDTAMLAEKFILLLATLRSHAYPDESPRVVSTSPHVPVKLPKGEQA